MQERINKYVVDLIRERRRLKRNLPEDPNALRFHGTSSRALPSINRHFGVLSPHDQEFAGDYSLRTMRGRYEFSQQDVRDYGVSLTSDLRTALSYAEADRVKEFFSEDRLRNLEENMFKLRLIHRGDLDTWPESYTLSEWKNFTSALRKGFHDYSRVKHFPVVVAVRAFNAPYVKELDPKVRAEKGEQLVVGIPANEALFFVPSKYLWHAKKLAPRLAYRIFPLELLVEYLENKGKRVFR